MDDTPPPGFVLHEGVLDEAMQTEVVRQIDDLLAKGRQGKLPGKTFSPVPPNFERFQQSREMLQFGVYTHSNRVELGASVLPLPSILCEILSNCLQRNLLPAESDGDTEARDPFSPNTIRNSGWCCTVNNYEEGQWIPPHVDSCKFSRPFATLSLLSEQCMEFSHVGSAENEGEEGDERDVSSDGVENASNDPKVLFSGATAKNSRRKWQTMLPVGSLLVIGGQAADEMTHAVPPVTARRISLTFRRLASDTQHKLLTIEADRKARAETKGEARRRVKAAKKELKKAAKRAAAEERRRQNRETGSCASDGASRHGKSVPLVSTHLSLNGDGTSISDACKRSDAIGASDNQHTRALQMPTIERDHVQRLYDAIAPMWHGTRYKAWPRVQEFIDSCPRGSLIADVGCGNGKNLPDCCGVSLSHTMHTTVMDTMHSVRKRPRNDRQATGHLEPASDCSNINAFQTEHLAVSQKPQESSGQLDKTLHQLVPRQCRYGIGCDFSIELVKIAARGGSFEALAADALILPYRSSCFDAAISIAVLHHISSTARRRLLVREALRVVRVGGRALFYAWAFEQDRTRGFSKHDFAAQDVLVPWHLRATGTSESQQHIKQQHQRLQRQKDEHTDEAINSGLQKEGSSTSSAPLRGTYDEEKKSIVLQRYCHVYQEGELRKIVESLNEGGRDASGEHGGPIEWVRIIDEYHDTGNWCLIAEKTAEIPDISFEV